MRKDMNMVQELENLAMNGDVFTRRKKRLNKTQYGEFYEMSKVEEFDFKKANKKRVQASSLSELYDAVLK